MSQHVFQSTQAGRTVEVMLGYDPPLDGFFMTVMIDGEIAYTNLEEENAFSKDLLYFRSKLTELGLQVPQEMFDEAELDRRVRDGARREAHGEVSA